MLPLPDPQQLEPDEIDVVPPGEHPEAGEMSPLEHLREALKHTQAALVLERDDADSAKLAQVVRDLYELIARRQDADDAASGANPKTMRALRRQAVEAPPAIRLPG